MGSWHHRGGIKDDELLPSGGMCVGKCRLFLLLERRDRGKPGQTLMLFVQVEERLRSDYEGRHFK